VASLLSEKNKFPSFSKFYPEEISPDEKKELKRQGAAIGLRIP
jgi:hypothetical protein